MLCNVIQRYFLCCEPSVTIIILSPSHPSPPLPSLSCLQSLPCSRQLKSLRLYFFSYSHLPSLVLQVVPVFDGSVPRPELDEQICKKQ